MKLQPGLWLVATPIGTAADITLHALDILRDADLLAAEDTRQARKLMDIHGIPLNGRKVIPYHDHNGAQQRPRLLAEMEAGKSVAYVSDAGTPLVADPGYQLAISTIEAGYDVRSAPGPSALLAALSVAGLPTDRFLFAGFAPVKSAARHSFLEEFSRVPATLVFYESAKRLGAMLADMTTVLGPTRPAAVCRELTKKFEETQRGTLSELSELYAGKPPKGEIVIVVAPPVERIANAVDIDAALRDSLAHNSVRDAAQEIADALDIPRKQAYARALEINRE